VESAGDGEAHRAQRRVIQSCSFAFRPSESAGRRIGVLREMVDRGERRGQGGDSEGSTAQLSQLERGIRFIEVTKARLLI
jgi:hypothetical protein